jgi:hypothetical protein
MRILYFLENNWVFGKIFNELLKFLHPDIDGDILCWTRLLSSDESALLREKYDLYFSTPVGCFFLHETYGWPLEKCYAHAHSVFDLDDALQRFPAEYFTKLAGYAVVSQYIKNASLERPIPREPGVLPVGVTAVNYARPMSTEIRRLGYFGRMARSDHDQPDLKRGYLAQRVAEQCGLEFVQREHVHFLAADQLYRDVDLVMFCSTTEGNPYVAIEAAAAGVPTLGTPVGIFPAMVQMTNCGVVLPLAETAFVEEACRTIRTLQANPALYQHMSRSATEAGRMFDWSNMKWLWQKEFQSLDTDVTSTRKDSHVSHQEKTDDQSHPDRAYQTAN